MIITCSNNRNSIGQVLNLNYYFGAWKSSNTIKTPKNKYQTRESFEMKWITKQLNSLKLPLNNYLMFSRFEYISNMYIYPIVITYGPTCTWGRYLYVVIVQGDTFVWQLTAHLQCFIFFFVFFSRLTHLFFKSSITYEFNRSIFY